MDPGLPTPSVTYARSSWLFLRLLGLAYLAAFWSFGVQVRGLIGHDGILPAVDVMAAVRQAAAVQHLGLDRFRLLPTIVWLDASDGFLQGLCVAGAGLSALLVAGLGSCLVLPLLWLLYLSLAVVSREFLSYQWDALLLEAGFLAIFLAPVAWRERLRHPPDPPAVARWLMWWLLFRLMFGSGLVKLASGDAAWRHLTALAVHYETQPLPTPLAWEMHQLPLWFQKASTAVVLSVELGAPWLIAVPGWPRRVACALLAGLQVMILLTGNYAFFNLLSIALCLLLLDDGAIKGAGWAGGAGRAGHWTTPRGIVTAMVAVVTVPVSLVALAGQAGLQLPGAAAIAPVESFIAPFESVNPYGLFAVMTTTRPEIIVEGSDDGVTWQPYEFKYKVGNPRRPPPWVAPHQPRLDWQMWFAALGRFDQEEWFQSFCRRLLQGSPDVLALLARNPFPGKPPRLVRGVLFQYHFADRATRRAEGVWWVRQERGPYSPTLSLAPR
jgi:lipase maturation factor 1